MCVATLEFPSTSTDEVVQRDTTAQALSWIFFHLLTNPEHVGPLRKEIDTVETVDYDSYKEMSQCIAAFHEVSLLVTHSCALLISFAVGSSSAFILLELKARIELILSSQLHPSVPKNGHEVIANDTLPDGTRVFGNADLFPQFVEFADIFFTISWRDGSLE